MGTKQNSLLIILLFVGVLMGALDISIVGPAIPSIDKSIQIAQRDLGWIFSIYILFNLAGISLFAKLSDIYGRKKIYIIAIIIFAIGSLIVSVANDFKILLIGRAVQGFGSSGFLPVASAVVGDVFTAEKRGRILGLIGAVFGIAFIIGPIIAGVLLKYFSWNVLFLINIPIALFVIIGSLKILPNTKSAEKKEFDWKGIILLNLSLGLFAYAINKIDSSNFITSILSVKISPLIIASFILLLLLFLVEKKSNAPIIKLEFLIKKQIVIAGILAFLTGLVQSSFVFIPTFASNIFSISASSASFMLIPLVFATAIGSPIFGRMIDNFGSKIIVIIGVILTSAGFFILHLVNQSHLIFYVSGIFIGFGLSVLSGSSLRYIMLNEVSEKDRAVSQGMLTIFVSLGQIIGAAIIGVIVAKQAAIQGFKNVYEYLSYILVVAFFVSFALKNKMQEKTI